MGPGVAQAGALHETKTLKGMWVLQGRTSALEVFVIAHDGARIPVQPPACAKLRLAMKKNKWSLWPSADLRHVQRPHNQELSAMRNGSGTRAETARTKLVPDAAGVLVAGAAVVQHAVAQHLQPHALQLAHAPAQNKQNNNYLLL